MAKITGSVVLARALKQQGVEYMFGIVGFPIVDIADAAQAEGITYIGMRNEQSASYAAQAASYLTGRPQACVVVSVPGVVHALAGLANAQQNCWPMILIGGASPRYQNGMGAFQEERQVSLAEPVEVAPLQLPNPAYRAWLRERLRQGLEAALTPQQEAEEGAPPRRIDEAALLSPELFVAGPGSYPR